MSSFFKSFHGILGSHSMEAIEDHVQVGHNLFTFTNIRGREG